MSDDTPKPTPKTKAEVTKAQNKTENFDPEIFFERILLPLLCPEHGDQLQVVYVKLKDGSMHPMLGAPMQENDWNQIEELEAGELVQINLKESLFGDDIDDIEDVEDLEDLLPLIKQQMQ